MSNLLSTEYDSKRIFFVFICVFVLYAGTNAKYTNFIDAEKDNTYEEFKKIAL